VVINTQNSTAALVRRLKGLEDALDLEAGAQELEDAWVRANSRHYATRGSGAWSYDLDDTGRLRGSLTRPGHPDYVFRARGDTITAGTRTPYARPVDARYARGQLLPTRADWLQEVLEDRLTRAAQE
jgi:hypothetical protein